MTKKKEIAATQELKDLIHRCILLTDRRGCVISKESTPVSFRLQMEYKKDRLEIYIYVVMSVMGSGSYQLSVKSGKKSVLYANGNFSGPYNYPDNPYISDYIPSFWEKKIPSIKELERR